MTIPARLVLLLGLLALPAPGAEIWVAPDGDDAAAGTREAPVATLARARDLARAQPAGGPLTVWLRGGTYPVGETLLLEAADGGSAGAPRVWAAAPGETVRLFGGVELPRAGFAPVTDPAVLERVIDEAARPRLLQCDLRAHGVSDLGEQSRHGFYKANLGRTPPPELYIDGVRQTLARWPNPDDHFPEFLRGEQKERHGVVGRAGIVDPGPRPDDPDFLTRGGTFTYAFDRPALWARADDVWLDGVFSWSWVWSYNKVAAIDPAAKTLTLAYGEVNGIADQYSYDYFFATNLLEEIDQPGEYYIDRASGRLYLLPPAGFDQATVTLSALTEPMIRCADASHLTFRNLVFDTGRAGAIEVRGGAGVIVEQCEIARFAGGAISLTGTGHGVRGCRLHHLGGAGVSLNGGDPQTLTPSGCFVEDSEIVDYAAYHKVYTPAVALGYRSVGSRVSHNRIAHGPHLGIVVYGNDHLIELNDIGFVCEDFTDMGAIYANLGARPLERGTVVRRNYFHDIGLEHHLQNGVYPDNMTMGWVIEENLFHRIGGPGRASNSRAINLNSSAHMTCRHNLFVDCTIPLFFSSHAGGANLAGMEKAWHEALDNLDLAALPHAAAYPELLRFWDEPRQFPNTNVFADNLIYNPTVPLLKTYGRDALPMTAGAFDQPGTLRIEGNWVADTDPGFVDAAGGDLSLKPDAPVFERIPGFPNIPFDAIGPRSAVGPR